MSELDLCEGCGTYPQLCQCPPVPNAPSADKRPARDLLADLADELTAAGILPSNDNRATLAREYRARTGKTPSQQSLAEALLATGYMSNTPPDEPPEPPEPSEPPDFVPAEDGAVLLAEVRAWLARFITVMRDEDLDVLTLWAAHTHAAKRLYTTPRLQLDSPVPESGKTTVLEHLERLVYYPAPAALISSEALLTRMVTTTPRTLLLDEVDKWDMKAPITMAILAVVNSGYKVGGKRPVLVPSKGSDGGWDVEEMSTFAPVAMAGNQPQLPDDTRTRIIRVLLLPDWTGQAEESDWEKNDKPAKELGARLGQWIRHADLAYRPDLPLGCRSRFREKWLPLARVAHAAGGRWPASVWTLAATDVEQVRRDKEEGLAVEKPAVLLLRHIADEWPAGQEFWRTTDLIDALIANHAEVWGKDSPYGKALTSQRLGRMLISTFSIRSTTQDRADKNAPRGYLWRQFGTVRAALSRSGGSEGSEGSGGSSEGLPHNLPIGECCKAGPIKLNCQLCPKSPTYHAALSKSSEPSPTAPVPLPDWAAAAYDRER